MEISSLLIRIIFLSLPGIATSIIYHKLIRRRSRRDWEDIFKIGLFSLINYCTLYIIIFLINLSGSNFGFHTYDAIFDETITLPGNEIVIATLLAIPIGFVLSFFSKKRLVNRIGQKLKATTLISDNDVWEDFLDLWSGKWVFVRDKIRNLTYYGYIDLYSESNKTREVVIRDVKVYTDLVEKIGEKTKHLYNLDAIYISRTNDYLTIEVPKEKEVEDEN